MRKGDLNFPNFAIKVVALRLSWIGRLLEKNNCGDAWKAIPKAFFEKYGGLNFLLKCNYKEVREKCIVILLRNARLL